MSFFYHHSCFDNLSKSQRPYADRIASVVDDVLFIPRRLSKVLDHLYLGNAEDARNVTQLKQEGITHVINTVEEYLPTGKQFYGEEFVYMGFHSEDDEKYPILKHFSAVYNFIEAARESNGKCLIHCMAGVNRSGCLAVAYVMVSRNIGPIEAAKQTFEARGMLLSNRGFIAQLVKMADKKSILEKDKTLLLKSS